MKKIKFYLVSILVALVFVSCEPEAETQTTIVDFEGVTLNANGIWNGSDLSGSFVSNNSTFKNSFNANWASWSGFACSSKVDSITPGYVNQYSTIAGSGAMKSAKFALAFDSATIQTPANANGNFSIKSLYLTNSTWAYYEMKNGGFGKKFAANDWFMVKIVGYKNKVKTSSLDVYLADFRSNKTTILKSWTKVDVSALGEVDMVTFTFDSTDKGQWGINTPTYVCLDNIEFTQTIAAK
jgi:hypothetical protein